MGYMNKDNTLYIGDIGTDNVQATTIKRAVDEMERAEAFDCYVVCGIGRDGMACVIVGDSLDRKAKAGEAVVRAITKLILRAAPEEKRYTASCMVRDALAGIVEDTLDEIQQDEKSK